MDGVCGVFVALLSGMYVCLRVCVFVACVCVRVCVRERVQCMCVCV